MLIHTVNEHQERLHATNTMRKKWEATLYKQCKFPFFQSLCSFHYILLACVTCWVENVCEFMDTHACMRKRASVHMWKRWKQAWMLLCFEFVLYKVWGILLKIGKREICSSLNIMFADEHFRHFMATSPATTTIISSPSDLPSYLLSSRHESNVVCAVLLWKMLSDPVTKC